MGSSCHDRHPSCHNPPPCFLVIDTLDNPPKSCRHLRHFIRVLPTPSTLCPRHTTPSTSQSTPSTLDHYQCLRHIQSPYDQSQSLRQILSPVRPILACYDQSPLADFQYRIVAYSARPISHHRLFSTTNSSSSALIQHDKYPGGQKVYKQSSFRRHPPAMYRKSHPSKS